MARKENFTTIGSFLIIFLLFCGALLYILAGSENRVSQLSLTPILILLYGIVVYDEYRISKRIEWVPIALIIVVTTFLIEVIGSKSGIPFGHYSYEQGLILTLFGVPLIIGINWVMVVLGAKAIVQQYFGQIPLWKQITAGAILTVIFDIVLEPAAISLNYWKWKGELIPVQNYISWFFIAVAILFLFRRHTLISPLWRILFLAEMGFFLLLQIII